MDTATNSVQIYDASNQLTSSGLTDVAIYGDIAYIATIDIGLARYDLTNDSFLTPWGQLELIPPVMFRWLFLIIFFTWDYRDME